MTDREKKKVGDDLLARLFHGQRNGKQNNDIAEGLRAGLASDHLSLDEGLQKGATVADPAKYAKAMDGHDEKTRKTGPIVRDINERIERAKQESAAITSSPEYRAKVLKQKRAMIHKAMTARGTDELTANIRGYDVTLIRLPETDRDGMRKIKMFVNGNEIPDKDFNSALAEVAGLNDGQAFNAAAQIGKEIRDQAGIQGARTLTQAGIHAAGAPVRAAQKVQQRISRFSVSFWECFLDWSLPLHGHDDTIKIASDDSHEPPGAFLFKDRGPRTRNRGIQTT